MDPELLILCSRSVVPHVAKTSDLLLHLHIGYLGATSMR
jgi:hypothetical protein